ncbi:hypothetical protein [Nonomuraea endophytica]|uniref:Uncharacterized protein n=1 Tax=Nonomuraea endophytica TaxID=714136 RepID=A0A7W8EKE7_9ACTN|nr:hypothetical protein [Nonomuraea endophytica]MBB5081717.1 hypothetical protein [Nonomuraea endophytica]
MVNATGWARLSVSGAVKAQAKSFDLAEPSFAFSLGDAGEEIVAPA